MTDSAWDDPIFELQPSRRRRPWGLVAIGLLVVGGLALMRALEPSTPDPAQAVVTAPAQPPVLQPLAPIVEHPKAPPPAPAPAPPPSRPRPARRDDLLGDRL